MTILQKVLLGLAMLVGGFLSGWYEKGVHVRASQAKDAVRQVKDITDSVNQQATALQARLQREQDASVVLLTQQQATRAASADIRLEITHADLSMPSAPGVEPSCPDPVGSPEFARLYQRAASLNPAPSRSSGAR
jgi:hypothetical protein